MKIPRILVVPIYVAIVVAFSFLVGFISSLFDAYNPTAWGFWTLIGIFFGVIMFGWIRQVWWYVSGTGDYHGRLGFLKRLWLRIFKNEKN